VKHLSDAYEKLGCGSFQLMKTDFVAVKHRDFVCVFGCVVALLILF